MIERVFGRCKEKNGFQWSFIRERSLKKLSMKAMLIFTIMNFKKMANWT